MEKSQYLETLEKIQNALNLFDMSFGISNKIFRVALVSEILDTTYLFHQLFESWMERLPFGEGPDADVDFAYWKELANWENLLSVAKQNACIDDYPIDMGNGLTTDKITGKRRKNYLKGVNAVLRGPKYEGKDAAYNFVKTINSDKTHMMTYGNMVFEALTPLLLILGKIDGLLTNPPQELLDNYYAQQLERFASEIQVAKERVQAVLQEQLPEKRKVNRLREMKDTIGRELCDSGFLNGLKVEYTRYDIEDYRREHACDGLDEETVRERMILDDLLTEGGVLNQQKITRYIFDNRRTFSRDCISSYFVYVEMMPELDRQIRGIQGCNQTYQSSEKVNEQSLADVIGVEKTLVVQQTIVVQGDIVQGNKTDIDKNYGPNIDHSGGALSLPEGTGRAALPLTGDDGQ